MQHRAWPLPEVMLNRQYREQCAPSLAIFCLSRLYMLRLYQLYVTPGTCHTELHFDVVHIQLSQTAQRAPIMLQSGQNSLTNNNRILNPARRHIGTKAAGPNATSYVSTHVLFPRVQSTTKNNPKNKAVPTMPSVSEDPCWENVSCS